MAKDDMQQTGSATSTPINKMVDPTLTKLLTQVQGELDKGPKPFAESTYGGVGDTTKNAWALGKDYATRDFGVEAPGYAALRSKLSNDVLTSTNAAFNGSGLFGADSNQKAAASGLADSLGALDYGAYQDGLDREAAGIQMLGGIGAGEDADRQAALLGRYDLSERMDNAKSDRLAKLAGIFTGSANSGGQQQATYEKPTPWWMTGASLLGQFL